ncbi:methyltransferase domain-containing protein [candidate division GN15 bacterium]|nr:methyltransferase domain-containing protein [candidate division GN15 bacterium]
MRIDETKLDLFVGKAVEDLAAGYGGVMISLGNRLGLYKAMNGGGPLSSVAVARRSGCAERYVREWLNSQAAAGYIMYHAETRTYELSPEQAEVLANDNSPVFMPTAWEIPASMWFDEEQAVGAFRTGNGVPWGDHNSRLFCGTAAFFRNAYRGQLVQSWIPALDGAEEKLKRGARVADVGCGHGHSTVLMAEAYPQSHFYGFDTHEGSIEIARRNAEEAGVADRVQFEAMGAQDYPGSDYDLICFFDCLHDLGDPVGAARYAAGALARDGAVMLVEPFAEDDVSGNLNTIGRLSYSASTVLCCAHSLSEEVGLALGAQAGAARLSSVFTEGGFGNMQVAMKTPLNLILEGRL